jgi:hypothetical protein
MSVLLLLACSNEFMLQTMDDPYSLGEDTGVFEDTAPPQDTAVEDTAVEEEPEEEPVEEEPEPEEEDPAPEDDCEGTSDLVYVVSRDDKRLYLFDPATLAFEDLGELECDVYTSPNSMAVARDGVGYVRYSDDTVYELDLETLDCKETSYGGGGFGSFGMGFATDSSDTWRDKLYVANATSLAVLNTSTWKLEGVGNMPSQSELTGNAEGELWAFLPLESPAELVQISKDSGSKVKTHKLPGFPSPYDIDAFAFATWDGSFYLFVSEYGMGRSTDVYEVDAAGNMQKVRADVGFDVVGAGVSTCAPS